MRRRTLLLLALGFFLLFGLLGVLFKGVGENAIASQTLADGSTITLFKITTGTDHTCVEGNIFQRTAGLLLPVAWLKKLNLNKAQLQSEFPTHVFWFRVTGPAMQLPGGATGFDFTARINDDGGGLQKSSASTGKGTTTNHVAGVMFPALPTGTPRLQFHVVRRIAVPGMGLLIPKTKALATLDVPNPAYLPNTRRHPVTLPARIQHEDLDFTVQSFGPRQPAEFVDPADMRHELEYLRYLLRLRVDTRAGSTNRWRLRRVRVLNELGGLLSENNVQDARGDWTWKLDPSVRPSSNSVWKLQFLLTVTTPAAVERHTFASVPITAGGQSNFFPITTQVGAFTLSVTGYNSAREFAATLQPPDANRYVVCENLNDPAVQHLRFYSNLPAARGLNPFISLAGIPSNTANLIFSWERQHLIEVNVRPAFAPPHP